LATVKSFVLAAVTLAHVAAAQGTIRGTVTSRSTGEPLADVRISVSGTGFVATSSTSGTYIVRGVPPGRVDLRVTRFGYQEATTSVNVHTDGIATANLSMTRSAASLPEVVTTATGEQRRVEVGNTIDHIGVPALMESAPIRSVTDLLNTRAPGVLVQQGTQTGTGARVRVRGIGSIALANDPIYVIDGVRLTSYAGASPGVPPFASPFSTLGNNPSRLGDLNPEEIETIEVVKGASAGTLYGTDAANGVIVITTKKGHSGNTQWTTFGEVGLLNDRNSYPNNYTLAGHSPSGALMIRGECNLPLVSAGTCIKDSVRIYTPITDPDATPLGYGYRASLGLQVSGGTPSVRYFISAARDDEMGVFQLPAFEQRRYATLKITPHTWTQRPNEALKNTFRVNVAAAVAPALDVTTNFSYVTSDQRFSIESNGSAGIGSQAFGGPGYKSNGVVTCVCAVRADSLNGYRAWTPGYSWEEMRGNTVNRFLVGSNLQWRPAHWLHARANVGVDFADRVESDLVFNGEGPPVTTTYRDGFAGRTRTNYTTLGFDVGATAVYTPRFARSLVFRTTVGTQYQNYREDQNESDGMTLPPGAQTATAGATAFVGETTSLQKTWGWFVEERVAVHDRLFVTGAVRTDENSSAGASSPRVYYPKAQLSWVVFDDARARRSGVFRAISQLRPRIAYGESGVQPRPTDASRQFGVGVASIGGLDQPYEVLTAPGNPALRPERSSELEGGFDSRWFGSRASLDVTVYSRMTHDALVASIIAPSVGPGTTTRLTNVGAIKNAGLEASLGVQLVDRQNVGVDVQVSSSVTTNRVVSLGSTPRQIGATNWVAEGYPIRGLFARPIVGWADKNHDGILTYNSDPARNEVFVGADTIFRGYAQPPYMTSLSANVSLFRDAVRIHNLIDWRGGNRWYNNTERIRCATRRNCNGLMNPAASLEEQAMVVAALNDPSRTLDGYLQPGAFVKWRESSITVRVPPRLLSRFRARSGTVALSARNLAKHTRYRGVDPESDFTATDGTDTPSEFQQFGAPTYVIVRLSLRF
jgi:TonB-dependent SusC/RagA subfamily outer membrane receptor